MNQGKKVETERDGQLAAYQRQAEQFDAILKKARSDVEEGRVIIDSLNHTIIDLGAQITRLSTDVETLNSTVAEIASSPSWRLTSPLRKFKQLISKVLGQSSPQIPVRADPQIPISPNREDAVDNDELHQFDQEFYLRMYPEVRGFYGGTPYDHYVAFGKREGRLGSLPSLKYTGDFALLDRQRDNVLVVSHEATATGAPVLSLNIIWELKKKYNVVSLVLTGGPMVDDFAHAADIAMGPVYGHGHQVFKHQVRGLLATCNFKFAIVNSAVSRIVLPELAKYFIPCIALIHEFAASIRPRNAIPDTIFWASEAIFSANIVRENVVSSFPELRNRLPMVIPQGKCLHFPASLEDSPQAFTAGQIGLTFRPAGWAEDTLVVLGIGSIQIRKGVDLFVACAARISQTLRCRFVWIGGGYDPDIENSYSMYLEDQVKRAGLSDCFAFMDETSQIDAAYEKADVLVLSSRLDPLPNIGIDAMSRGLPFVCFDKTTGFAEVLRTNGLETECLAPYLDIDGLASRVLAFLENPELRSSVGSRLRAIAEQTFNMATYVNQLESIALKWTGRTAQESVDCTTIAQNPLLDFGYLAGPLETTLEKEMAIRAFVRSWASGLSLRKPYAGFHPGIYLEQCGISNLDSNPLAHYMRSGSPAGPWSYEVIIPSPRENDELPLPTSSVALHLHIFYPDLAPIIMDRLNANRVRPDLFISVPTEAIQKEIERMAGVYEGRTIEIQVVPNRGRDIGPLLTAFGDRFTGAYEFVGHFHTKKTADLADSTPGEIWYTYLLENLIGGKHKMADLILSRMAADSSIGIVYPDDPNVIGWSCNREHARKLASRMNISEPTVTHFNFPVGTMFWARSSAIRPLITMNLEWKDYPMEPLPYDGSMLHAIERLIPFVTESTGFRAVATNVPGVVR